LHGLTGFGGENDGISGDQLALFDDDQNLLLNVRETQTQTNKGIKAWFDVKNEKNVRQTASSVCAQPT
jgi:hypothetical protein